ncbi:hypothetical protein HMF8227_01766 [Saliniradius amylolyticus]|uniref:Solute-binding protein family 3/N-terminal domain-containing protein n=1 Tax=Saliniradius amylolyticus TaxID=2183582 RepID=A0A2S2E3R4_9ALTE|nr:transporter substrate-binding domain-containing protein [Saliniradius amylolyticus]AWL12239.1 hypothetical protein HMF8227_01766 [Saliniradius amylolyticus]
MQPGSACRFVKISICLFFIILVSAGITSQPTHANTLFVVGAPFPRISVIDSRGHPSGLGVEIVRQIAQQLGYKTSIQLMPLERALREMRLGKADLMIGPYYSDQREQYMRFSQFPFYSDPILLYVRKDYPLDWNGELPVLEGHLIGLSRGWNYGQAFNRYKMHLSTYTVNSVRANFIRLAKGRIDVFLCHPRHATALIEQLGLEAEITALPHHLTTNHGYFGFSKIRPTEAFQQRFERAFDELKKTGKLNQLNRHYGLTQAAIPKHL